MRAQNLTEDLQFQLCYNNEKQWKQCTNIFLLPEVADVAQVFNHNSKIHAIVYIYIYIYQIQYGWPICK